MKITSNLTHVATEIEFEAPLNEEELLAVFEKSGTPSPLSEGFSCHARSNAKRLESYLFDPTQADLFISMIIWIMRKGIRDAAQARSPFFLRSDDACL